MPVFSWFKIEKADLVIAMVASVRRALVFCNFFLKVETKAAIMKRQKEKRCSSNCSQSHDGSEDASDSHDAALALVATSRLVPLQVLELAQIDGSATVLADMFHGIDGVQAKLNERNGHEHRCTVTPS